MQLTRISTALFLSIAASQAAAAPGSDDPFLGLDEKISSMHTRYEAQNDPRTPVEIDKLALDLFTTSGVSLQRQAVMEAGSVLFKSQADPSAIFDLDIASGDFLFNKGYAGLYGQNSTPGLPSADVAPDVAKNLLKGLGLLPQTTDELTIDHVGGINMGARNEDGSVHEFQKLVTVRFGRQIDGTPVVGPGSRIVVRLGEQAGLAALIHNWSKVERRALSVEERLTMGEVHQLVRLRLEGVEAKTLDKTIASADVVLFDDGRGVIEPAIRVVATLTMEQVLDPAAGPRESRIIENPYDFFIPLCRDPKALFPFMKAPPRSAEEAK